MVLPTTPPQITRAETMEDAATAANIIARAFSALPVCQWLVPDPELRERMLAEVFQIQVEHALSFGTVYLFTRRDPVSLINDVMGVAVWFDNTRDVPPPPDYEERLLAASGTRNAQFGMLDGLFEEHHPHQPHHYLAFMAVEPGHQDSGIGTALLQHHQAFLDEERIPAYLEASTQSAARLYERHGYTRRGPTFSVQKGAEFIPMWRGPVWDNE